MLLKNSLGIKLILVLLVWSIFSTIPATYEKTNQLLDSNAKYYENLKLWPNNFLGLSNDNHTGQGVKIAILDTEIKFKKISNLKKEYRFLSDNQASSPVESTHGDQIVNIINSTAPGAEIYLIVVSNKEGQLKENDLKNALNWLIKNKVDIVNMSFGFNSKMPETIEPLLEKLYKTKTVMVAASGNEGKSRLTYPASSPYVISVGANDFLGQRWLNSNYGKELDFNLPGVKIIDNYRDIYVDGTSFSTAFMSGIIARLKEDNLNISNKSIYTKLVGMTDTHRWNQINGYGTPTFK